VRVTIDDRIERLLQAVIVIVANGKYFGGGMKIAPLADPTDGHFDVVLVKDLSPLKILRNLHRIYSGSHLELPQVEVLRGKKVVLESEEEILLEADGELLGRGPAEFNLHSQAVQVIC
jgi:diacylglycerol kinase family enzyme